MEVSAKTFESHNINHTFKHWEFMFLPSVRENTGSAELRISSETQFAMIWKKNKLRGNSQ